MAKNGIDVSHHQGKIDWKKVKAAGYEFAFVKIGNCWKDGSLGIDAYFADNVRGALSAGIKVGIYGYMYTRTVDAARLAARNVAATLSTYHDLIDLPVACDMEEAAVANTGRANCTAMATAWRDAMREAGYIPALYCNPSWLKSYITRPNDMPLWLAHYAIKPYCDSDIWQFSATGRVSGISGDVDLDYGFTIYPEPVPVPPVGYDISAALEYLAKAGAIDSPEFWAQACAGSAAVDPVKHLIPLLCKFADAVEDKDTVLDELQDIIVAQRE